MRGNPAAQILHTNAVYLPEETLAEELTLLTHVPDNDYRARHKQHADKHSDIDTQSQSLHLTGLLLNLYLFAQDYRILPITHIQLGDTHLYPFAADGIIQTAITFQVLISMAVITGTFKIMLKILIAYAQHIGIEMPHGTGTGNHLLRLRYISFLQGEFNHLGLDVIHSRVVLYFREKTITLIQVYLRGIEIIRQHV